MNLQERLQLYTVRKELGKEIGFNSISNMHLGESFQLVLDSTLDEFSNSSDDLKIENLRSNREKFGDKLTTLPTAPVLTARAIVNDSGVPIEEQAIEEMYRGNVNGAIALTDISYGILTASTHIVFGENSIRQGADSDTLNYLENIESICSGISEADETDIFIRHKSRSVISEELLIEDPSGFYLLDEVMLNLKGKPSRFDNIFLPFIDLDMPDFVIQGGEFFQKFYKRVYPFAKIPCETA